MVIYMFQHSSSELCSLGLCIILNVCLNGSVLFLICIHTHMQVGIILLILRKCHATTVVPCSFRHVMIDMEIVDLQNCQIT